MKPAAYSYRNTEELEAIRALENLLALRYEKPDLKRLDSRPNSDGTIEIVDEEQRPLGKIEVQVRKIPNGETSYQCPIELIAYSETISLPFILICVDVGNNRAYFRHLHRGMMPELEHAQQSFVIRFDPKVDSISSETQYRLRWLELTQEYNKRISDYARLREIENQLNPSHISKEDHIYFQEYIDHLNRLLDVDFPIVKERFFKGVWKLGVGVSSADKNEVAYQIYTIYPGEPAILVSGIPYSRTVTFTFSPDRRQKEIQYHFQARAALKSARQEAADFVLGRIQSMIQSKQFSICGKYMATEYLFWFVDHFGVSIGTEEADRLNVSQLNYGISIYLPAWASIAVPRFLGELIRLNKNNAQAITPALAAPPFEHIAATPLPEMLAMMPQESRPRHQPTKNEVLALIKSGNSLRPARVSCHEISPQSLMEAVEFLLAANQEWIDRLYKPRTSEPDTIWSGYNVEALRHNLRMILVESLEEYRIFIERNSIPLKNSLYLHQPVAIIYVANLSEWVDARGFSNTPYLEKYIVRNRDNKIPKMTMIDTSDTQIDFVVEKQSVRLNGIEREIISNGCESPDKLFDKRPILTRFYSMLQYDLENEFKQTRYAKA